MNKNYKIVLLIIIVICLSVGFSVFNEGNSAYNINNEFTDKQDNYISKLISERKSKSYFTEFNLLRKSSKLTLSKLNEFAKTSDIFDVNESQLQIIYNMSPQDILITIDSKYNGLFELELTELNLAPEYIDIQVISGNNITHQKFKTGLSYGGIIKGDNKSFALLTIFENSVMGLICNDKGNFVLGPKKDENNKLTRDYVFYNDRDLLIKNNFKCDVDDYSPIHQKGLSLKKSLFKGNIHSSATTDSIRVFFVADYQMYLDNGSNITQVGQFINGVFNNTILIYHNEQIPVRLASSISVYTSPDPYINLNDSYAILNLFGANTQDNFNGDLAHLLSTRNAQLGGIAWINILCQPYVYFPPPDDAHYGRFAFSNIDNNYLPYPTYSWTVMVITHEMGHNISSKHTHACVWPTISGQIDSCYTSEGGCVTGTQQNFNGTVMSYCHLNGAINLVNGFGPLPQDTIQLGYSLAGCLDTALNSSELPITFDLMQNYPNPFNPGTKISFALPESGYVTLKIYDITGREITTLANNKFYEAGFFSANFNASDYRLASGVYLYRIDVKKDNNSIYSQIKKMVLVK